MTRVQFDVDEKKMERVDAAIEEFGIRTRARFLEDAMDIYMMLLRSVKNGKIPAVMDPNSQNYSEIFTSGLENARARQG